MSTPAQRIPLSATSGVTPLASLTAVQVFAAQAIVGPSQGLPTVLPGAGTRKLRIFVTDITLSNSSSTAAIVTILDGTTNVLWAGNIPATSGEIEVDLTTPLVGSPGNVLSIQSSAAAANISWDITGYAAST